MLVRKGLELSFSGSGHGLARCEVIALNPNNPQVGEEPVGDDGVIALASALFRCHRLRRLDVSHSNISSVGLKALLKGLKHAKVRLVQKAISVTCVRACFGLHFDSMLSWTPS